MKKGLRPRLRLVACVLGVVGCSGQQDAKTAAPPTASSAPAIDGHLFTRMPSSYTGVTFANTLTYSAQLNVFTYRNFYNGGGVALGDLNGDGLPEIMLTGNQQKNHLYLNKGHFKFEDITAKAGVAGNGDWATGVTMADVNGDGLLDIYICYGGNVAGPRRANELYINQGVQAGVPTFKEMAAQYGLDDEGPAIQATFLDYDHDGRLDLFVLNNSYRPVSSFAVRNTRSVRDPVSGDKLFHNDGNGKFSDVSARA